MIATRNDYAAGQGKGSAIGGGGTSGNNNAEDAMSVQKEWNYIRLPLGGGSAIGGGGACGSNEGEDALSSP